VAWCCGGFRICGSIFGRPAGVRRCLRSPSRSRSGSAGRKGALGKLLGGRGRSGGGGKGRGLGKLLGKSRSGGKSGGGKSGLGGRLRKALSGKGRDGKAGGGKGLGKGLKGLLGGKGRSGGAGKSRGRGLGKLLGGKSRSGGKSGGGGKGLRKLLGGKGWSGGGRGGSKGNGLRKLLGGKGRSGGGGSRGKGLGKLPGNGRGRAGSGARGRLRLPKFGKGGGRGGSGLRGKLRGLRGRGRGQGGTGRKRAGLRGGLRGLGRGVAGAWKRSRAGAAARRKASGKPPRKRAEVIAAGLALPFAIGAGLARKLRQRRKGGGQPEDTDKERNTTAGPAPEPPERAPGIPLAPSTTHNSGRETRRMSGNVGAAAEAVEQHLGSFSPENVADFDQFLKDLPEFFGAVGAALGRLADRFADELPIDQAVAEHIREMGAQAAGQQDYASEAYSIFRNVHESDLERLENPRPGEEFLDYSKQ
jgi:hypothetical protein